MEKIKKKFFVVRSDKKIFNYRIVCFDALNPDEELREKEKTSRMFSVMRDGRIVQPTVLVESLGRFTERLLANLVVFASHTELLRRLVDCALPLMILDIAQEEGVDSALNFIGRLCDLGDSDFDDERERFSISGDQYLLDLMERDMTKRLTKYMLQLEAANADIN